QPGVDVPRGFLAMADPHRDRALRRNHVATGEDPRMARHHVACYLDRAVLDGEPGDTVEERKIDVLTERQHQRIGLERLKLARRLRKARRSEEHTSELQSPYDLVCRLLLEKK